MNMIETWGRWKVVGCKYIADIDDLITFEAGTLDELEKQFQLAVDDYIEFCREVGRNGI